MKKNLLVVMAYLFIFTACDPVPRRTLSNDEKIADLMWVYSKFSQNYAPLEYKEKKWGISFETLKQEYISRAVETKTNEAFYLLLQEFVSRFKDAHTAATLTTSALPNRAQVAYLGFSGIRKGARLLVKEILPTINTSASNYPLKAGDAITKINGTDLLTYIRENLSKYRDLGNDEANLTYHMNRIFTRLSTRLPMPESPDVTLTMERSGKTTEITLPWVVKDLVVFKQEQAAATADKEKNKKTQVDEIILADEQGTPLVRFGLLDFNGRPFQSERLLNRLQNPDRVTRFWDSFVFLDPISRWTILAATEDSKKDPTPEEIVKAARFVPENALFIPTAKIFPAYLLRKATSTGFKMIGYIYLDTFSPDGSVEDVIKEFKATLKTFESFGISDIIIDTINNGGGSLSLGFFLAQALTNEKIELSKIQFRLSDSWLDDFESMSLTSKSDISREYARRVLATLKEDQTQGLRLSRPISIENWAPYTFLPNDQLKAKFNITLLVNEMCASMCDIFAGVLQDNKMATVLGTNSMGAGGNVVQHYQSPNSNLDLTQTESLIVRRDGSYVENVGVKPDVELATNESADEKYEAVVKQALELLSNSK